ncbi:MAG TPA: hypothetical protein VMU45_07265 [Candidatus Eisenbacteria bacterium]|nr:hypothetical protein [Candidatus Eisenbacteria bacterium]
MFPFLRKVLLILLIVGTMAAADFTGTWKLNPEKSKLGNRDISQGTLTIRQTGPDTYTSTLDYVTKSGEKRHQESVRVCDGKEHAVPHVDPSKFSTVMCQVRPGPTRKIVEKENGKVIVEMTSTVSADGKVMTNVWKYEDGEVVFVFDRL